MAFQVGQLELVSHSDFMMTAFLWPPNKVFLDQAIIRPHCYVTNEWLFGMSTYCIVSGPGPAIQRTAAWVPSYIDRLIWLGYHK